MTQIESCPRAGPRCAFAVNVADRRGKQRRREAERGDRQCGTGGDAPAASGAFDDREDVAFAVLEPRSLCATRREHATRTLLTGQVVIFEDDAACLQRGDFAFDVIDIPERLARLGRAGIGGGVEERGRSFANP